MEGDSFEKPDKTSIDSELLILKETYNSLLFNSIKMKEEIDDFFLITSDILESGINRNNLRNLGVRAFIIKSCLNYDSINDPNLNDLYSKLSQLIAYINNFSDTIDYRLEIIHHIKESRGSLEELVGKN